jgi:transposase
MLFDRRGLRVFVYREAIDMRCGFERLHSYCIHQMLAKMDQGHVYLFFGKNRRRLKCLFYDGSGLVLIAKRIERGSFMSLAELLGRAEITIEELKLIFHGSLIRRPILDRSVSPILPPNLTKLVTQREGFALPKGSAETTHNGPANP